MISNQYSASFSNVGLNGKSTPWGCLVAGFVTIDTPALLASVVLTFDWTDHNGAQSKQVSVPLTVAGLSVPFIFPVFASANSVLYVSGTVVGSPTFTLNVGTPEF